MVLLQINWNNAFSVVGLGFGMVLVILTLLILLLTLASKISTVPSFSLQVLLKKKKATPNTGKSDSAQHEHGEVLENEEHIAAIAMALHSYFDEVHDIESNIITMKDDNNHNSPWKMKIYGMSNYMNN